MGRQLSLSAILSYSSSSFSLDKWKSPSLSPLAVRVIWQVCFTLFLLVLWSSLLVTYFTLVPPRGPRQYGAKLTPGLSFRPRPENPKSTLIHFRHGGSGNWRPLKARFKAFLKDFGFGKRAGGFIKCNYNTHIKTDERCGVPNRKAVDASYDTPCSGAESYGMFHGQPCLIIKINRVFGWEPEPYYNLTQHAPAAEGEDPGYLDQELPGEGGYSRTEVSPAEDGLAHL